MDQPKKPQIGTDQQRYRIIKKLTKDDGFGYFINSAVAKGHLLVFYLSCSKSRNPNQKCPAKRIATLDTLTDTILLEPPRLPHNNHPAPAKKRLSPALKDSIVTQAQHQLKPEQIRTNLATDNPGEYVGTQRQIRYLQNKTFGLPSGEDLARLLATGAEFIRELSLFSESQPSFRMICWRYRPSCPCKMGQTLFH
jgi:hypothetical protein